MDTVLGVPEGPDTVPPQQFGRTDSQRETNHRACDVCKRRKVRCSGTNPCQQCQRNRSSCAYSSTYGKLTALERRLRQSEHRVASLTAAWRHFLPTVDPDAAIAGLIKGESLTSLTNNAPPPASESHDSFAGNNDDETSTHPRVLESQTPPTPDLELDSVEALEWDESLETSSMTDGIGSLTLRGRASGYMGPQSGNALLRYLQSVGSFLSDDGFDLDFASPACPQAPAAQVQPESGLFRSQCIEWYFEHFHKAYPILHEGFFRAQYMGAISKPKDGSWAVLCSMVLAIGAFAGPQSSTKADLTLYSQARAALTVDLLQRGSLHLVQAVALLANYLQKRNMPNSGFTFLGIALNMALGLGLNREFSESSISAFTREVRRRVWWTLFIFDSGARLTFGRPTMVLLGVNVKAPHNLDDIDLPVDVEDLIPSVDHPTVTSSLIWQVKLAEISNDANSRLLEQRLPSKAEMLALDDRILAWSQSLPSYFMTSDPNFPWFEVPRMVLLWRSQHLRIVVTRPFLLDVLKTHRQLNDNDANGTIGRCISAAHDCARSIIAFCVPYQMHQTYSGALTWYATYWLVTAVFVHVTCLVYDPYHQSAPIWRVHVEESRETLQTLAGFEPLAGRAAYIISRIMELMPSSPGMTTISTNEPIRMGIADLWSESWFSVEQTMDDLVWAQSQIADTSCDDVRNR